MKTSETSVTPSSEILAWEWVLFFGWGHEGRGYTCISLTKVSVHVPQLFAIDVILE